MRWEKLKLGNKIVPFDGGTIEEARQAMSSYLVSVNYPLEEGVYGNDTALIAFPKNTKFIQENPEHVFFMVKGTLRGVKATDWKKMTPFEKMYYRELKGMRVLKAGDKQVMWIKSFLLG